MTKRVVPNPSDDYALLVREAAGGDEQALEQLLMRAQEVAYRFGHTVCGDTSDAEDVMQEALLKTFRHVRRIRDPGAFRTWLYRTVRNACLMKRRRKVGEPYRVLSLDELLPSLDGGPTSERGRNPEALAVNAALRRRLGSALRRLPPGYRTIVFLREMEGLSVRDIARVLKISESNVKMRLHRARLLLRKQLEG